MGDDSAVAVEVAYARPEEQLILRVQVPLGATVEQAIGISKIVERFPEIDLDVNKVGIFGNPVRLDAKVGPGDRVEIYRPLIADPREMRRQRATGGKRAGRGA
jgi:hypothetical protein